MNNDFIIVQQRPTPEELLEAVIHILPDFSAYWNQSDTYFRNDDGSFSGSGVFAELADYVRESFFNINEPDRVKLFDLIEECVQIRTTANGQISNHLVSDGACTCFLENIAGEAALSAAIVRYLGVCSKEYFDKWN